MYIDLGAGLMPLGMNFDLYPYTVRIIVAIFASILDPFSFFFGVFVWSGDIIFSYFKGE